MEKVTEWSCLTVNTEKTASVFSENKRNQSEHPHIYVGRRVIKNVEGFKYPGVILDSSLTAKKNTLKKSVVCWNLTSTNFRHIRTSLPTKAVKSHINAVIMSHFLCCTSSCSQAKKTVLNPVRSLYDQAFKMPDKKPQQHHHCNILKKCKMLSFVRHFA